MSLTPEQHAARATGLGGSDAAPACGERWLPVVGFEGFYEVSDLGRVRSLDRTVRTKGGATKRHRGRVLTPKRANNGYLQVDLSKLGVTHQRLLHRLVLEAFVGPHPANTEACHAPDPDTSNNRATNLRWDTHANNCADRSVA